MSRFKGTPGPWIVREVRGVGLPGQIGYAIDFNQDQEQVVDYVYEKPDAQLIAAAPDLLAACQAAEWNSLDLPESVRIMLTAAIDKALGQ